ncbi:MAG: response regulator transcription factor [Clostridiales bacterium]|nr:response regulator transcription factor [Clostridiales bacterium]MCF8021265.1 response regulator transcription factor [Clostridiales bacterium]
MSKLLILEDEDSIRSFIRVNLKRSGFDVVEACTGEEALEKINESNISIAILDIMLPGIDGFEICKILREQYANNIGIIMLTARGQDEDKVNGLVLGADDYVVKPFSPQELVARVQALTRRLNASSNVNTEKKNNILSTGSFSIDLKEKRFFKEDEEIDLTPKEFNIIKLLMESPDNVVSRDEILNRVWGQNYIGDLKVVDVNIRRIRKKIEEDPASPKYLKTVWGVGYRLARGDKFEKY